MSRCLEAVSRGLNAKARRWLAKKAAANGVAAANGANGGTSALTSVDSPNPHSVGISFGVLGLSEASGATGYHLHAGSGMATPTLRGAASYSNLADQPIPTVEREDAMLTGHVNAVLSSALDEARSRLYTAGKDCTVRVRRGLLFLSTSV